MAKNKFPGVNSGRRIEIGGRIKRRRRRQNRNIDPIAVKLGIASRTIKAIEGGRFSTMRREIVLQYAAEIGFTAKDLGLDNGEVL